MTDIYTQLDTKVAKLDVNYKERDRLNKANDKLRATIETGTLSAIKEAEAKAGLNMNAEALLILEERNKEFYLNDDDIFELTQALADEAKAELQSSFSDAIKSLKQAKNKVDGYIEEANRIYKEKEQKKNTYGQYTEHENNIYNKAIHQSDTSLTYIQSKLKNQLENL